MNNKLFFSLLLLSFQTLLFSQDSDKIKGDRNVTIKQTYVDDFESITVTDDFSIDLIYNSKPSIEVEADDNLHEVIEFAVVDKALTISALKRITSKKTLKITVNYGESLANISVKNDSEIRSLTSMELGSVSLTVEDNSRAYLNINATDFEFRSTGKSKTRLNITASGISKIYLNDDSKLDALINCPIVEFDLLQRTDATIEGAAEKATIRIDNSSNFYGNNYSLKECSLFIEGNSDATIEVQDQLTFDASGKTETFLYGEPTITVNRFTGSARLQKKER
jgi:hypothetical protein